MFNSHNILLDFVTLGNKHKFHKIAPACAIKIAQLQEPLHVVLLTLKLQ